MRRLSLALAALGLTMTTGRPAAAQPADGTAGRKVRVALFGYLGAATARPWHDVEDAFHGAHYDGTVEDDGPFGCDCLVPTLHSTTDAQRYLVAVRVWRNDVALDVMAGSRVSARTRGGLQGATDTSEFARVDYTGRFVGALVSARRGRWRLGAGPGLMRVRWGDGTPLADQTTQQVGGVLDGGATIFERRHLVVEARAQYQRFGRVEAGTSKIDRIRMNFSGAVVAVGIGLGS